MKNKKSNINQDKSSEVNSWVLREAELHGSFESFPIESLEKILNRTIKVLGRNSKILDLGCGTGFFSREIAKAGHKVCGIDVSNHMIDYAKKTNADNLSFLLGDVEKLPFKRGCFDACFCGVILHHFPDIHKMSQEMFRVLKGNGFIFGVEPNKKNWHVFLSMSLRSPFRYSKNTPNERAMSPFELVEVLKEGLGMKLKIEFHFLKMPHEGKSGFWDRPVIYKLFGFVIKKIKGFHKRLLAILVFNLIHFIQIFQCSERKANFLIFTARKQESIL